MRTDPLNLADSVTNQPDAVIVRLAETRDLEAVNRVVRGSTRSWAFPERVQRLAAPSLKYSIEAESESNVEYGNVDPTEAARFGNLASAWWDPAGPFWPLHRLNTLRAAYLRDTLAGAFGRLASDPLPLTGIEVVDIGCGGGILSESMARMGARVHGVDVVQRNVEIARQHAHEAGLEVRYETTTVDALAAGGARYDVVLNMEVVEHVPDVASFMDDCAQLVRPGGVMALATLNRTVRSWLFAIVGAEYVLRWLPRGTHRWDRFVTPREARALLARNNLDVVSNTGVRVNPFNRRFTLARDMGVNYMLVARRQTKASDGGHTG